MEAVDNLTQHYKSGFVAVMGQPNVGKSTLVNALLGTKIAAVSPWPQTTRKRQMGILTLEQAQIIFVDTPGVHQPLHKLGERMNKEALEVLEECDYALLVVDGSQAPGEEDQMLIETLTKLKRSIPILMILNKIDLANDITLLANQAAYQALLPRANTLMISATQEDNLEEIVFKLVSGLPEGPPFFPEDQLTDLYEREIVADLIREAVLHHLRAEVPHSIAVRIDEYKERDQENLYIAATLFVERESQKGIVIGQGGIMLKNIGTAARQKIEAMMGSKVFLSLRIKVQKNWRNDETALRQFGFGA
ncbi:MAG: GTPase Era [Chloroflexi bacterium RBG_19FT_COMBO_47_9]|nr:MAG: GTPase Era [Chloroflexi bacterium RBG_19FT_COMBO_47_9]